MARRRSRRRSGENLVTPGTETAPGILDEAADEMQEAINKEYKDANTYNHNGVDMRKEVMAEETQQSPLD